jgi:hypothetical protein
VNVSAEFEVDLGERRITATVRREFDVTPITLTIPFAVWKAIAGQILMAEAEAEKQATNGHRPQLVTPAGRS